MSRKRTHRKVYALVNPIAHAIAGAAITDTAALDQLRMRELTALDALVRGQGARDDWKAMADMANVAETMARMGIGPEVLSVCERAGQALMRAHGRFKLRGSMALDGEGIQALRELAEYHDLQRTSVSRSQYEVAIRKTADRIRSGAADVRVLS